MSSKKYAAPLQLDLKPSRILLLSLVFSHLAAIVVILTLHIPVYLSASFIIMLFSIGVWLISLHAIHASSKSVNKIVWDANDEWLLFFKDGSSTAVTLLGDSYIHPRLTVLRFKESEKFLSRSVVLIKDNIHVDVFRRLRVRLKLSRGSDVEKVA